MKRLVVCTVIIVLVATAILTSVHIARSQASQCDPTFALSYIKTKMESSGTKEGDLYILQKALEQIQANIDVCKAEGVVAIEPGVTPTVTPAVTATNTPTLSAAQIQGVTRTAVADSRTATASVKQTATAVFAQFKPIDRRELVSYADQHKGESVKVKGRVFNVVSSFELQIMIQGSNDALYVTTAKSFSGIYENDYVTVYGIVGGYTTITNGYGQEIKQPEIVGALITKP